MLDESHSNDIFDASSVLEALEELEQSSHEQYVRMRSSDRVDIHAKIKVRPGNSGDRHRTVVEGMTTDLSAGGCRALVLHPLLPGDIFYIEFDREKISIDPLLVRCLRCKLVREDSFDVSFRFFSSIDLTGAILSAGSDA